MKTSDSSNPIPVWHSERAKVLQRACLSVKAAVQRGDHVQRAIHRTARRLNGRLYKSAPSRRLALSPNTMRRLWDAWRRGGEIPVAFKLHWNPSRKIIPAPVFIRFAEFCASSRHRSLASAWSSFSRRNGALGLGSAGRSLGISDYLVRRHFPGAQFYLMQSKLKAMATAQTELQQIKFKAIIGLRRSLPDRLPRRRYVRRAAAYEI